VNILLAGKNEMCEIMDRVIIINGHMPTILQNLTADSKTTFDLCVFFEFSVWVDTELEIAKIKQLSPNVNIMAVSKKPSIENMAEYFKLGIGNIFYSLDPDLIMQEILDYLQKLKSVNKTVAIDDSYEYRVNFFINKQVLFIDIHGRFVKENLKYFKLKIADLTGRSIKYLKGVVYIFQNISQQTIYFENLWYLFGFWNDLDIQYNKVHYLTTSEYMTTQTGKYFGKMGLKKSSDLFEIVSSLFPEVTAMNDEEKFEFVSSFLESKPVITNGFDDESVKKEEDLVESKKAVESKKVVKEKKKKA